MDVRRNDYDITFTGNDVAANRIIDTKCKNMCDCLSMW